MLPLVQTNHNKNLQVNDKLPANLTGHKLLEYPVFGINMHRPPRLLREVFVTAMQGDTPIDCHQQHTDVALY